MKILIVLVLSSIICFTIAKNLNKRDLRDDLEKRAAALEANATAVIKKLQAANQTSLAAGVERELKQIQELAKELKNENGPEAIRLLENELNRAEARLTNEIRALETVEETKQRLVENAKRIEGYLAIEIKKLQDAGRTSVASLLLRQGAELQRLSERLTESHNSRTILALEVELRALEVFINTELKRLEPNGISTPKPVSSTQGSTRPSVTPPRNPTGSTPTWPTTGTPAKATPTRPATATTGRPASTPKLIRD